MIESHNAATLQTVSAGSFGKWLTEFRASLRGDGGTDVPCGDCVGCCVSSYFIPVRPKDTAALDAIPAKWLVGTQNQPGHFMMGYLGDGTCPMLNAGKCSIYAHRPQTCRDYDCRVFAAAGIDAGGPDKFVINKRVREWRFAYESEEDLAAHRAMQETARFIQVRRDSFPGGRAPTAPTGIAVLAAKAYKVFLDRLVENKSDADVALAIIKASGEFDSDVS